MPHSHSFRASAALALTFLTMLASSQNYTNMTNATSPSPSLEPTSMPTQIYTDFPTVNPSTTTTTTLTPTSAPTTLDPTSDPTAPDITTTSFITAFPTSNPTSEPSLEPTMEPTVEPTSLSPTQSLSPTAAPTSPSYTEVEIIITITFTATNATEDELAELIFDAIDDVIASLNLTVLDFNADDFVIEIIENDSNDASNSNTDRRRLIAPTAATYSFRITLSVLDEADIDSTAALISSIESVEFAAALENDIESATFSEIAENGLSVSAEETASDEDDEEGVDWLDWTTWQLLNWIMVGGAALVLCVLSVCLCRCVCVVFCCREQRERKKSEYKMGGGAMFDRVDSHNTGKEKQFQSDLRQAIEMNKRGALLKKKESKDESLDLDAKEIGAAFDMNFDEKTPMNAKGKGTEAANVVSAGKSEGGDVTGDPLIRGATPGGPEVDEEENVPPAPNPPAMTEEDEHAAAYDLL